MTPQARTVRARDRTGSLQEEVSPSLDPFASQGPTTRRGGATQPPDHGELPRRAPRYLIDEPQHVAQRLARGEHAHRVARQQERDPPAHGRTLRRVAGAPTPRAAAPMIVQRPAGVFASGDPRYVTRRARRECMNTRHVTPHRWRESRFSSRMVTIRPIQNHRHVAALVAALNIGYEGTGRSRRYQNDAVRGWTRRAGRPSASTQRPRAASRPTWRPVTCGSAYVTRRHSCAGPDGKQSPYESGRGTSGARK